jgi:hypothetical protein
MAHPHMPAICRAHMHFGSYVCLAWAMVTHDRSSSVAPPASAAASYACAGCSQCKHVLQAADMLLTYAKQVLDVIPQIGVPRAV